MEWTTLCATARRTTNDNWYRHPYTPVHFASHIDDLIEATGDEVNKLHLGNGAHSHQCRPYCGTNNGSFGHWCINDTL